MTAAAMVGGGTGVGRGRRVPVGSVAAGTLAAWPGLLSWLPCGTLGGGARVVQRLLVPPQSRASGSHSAAVGYFLFPAHTHTHVLTPQPQGGVLGLHLTWASFPWSEFYHRPLVLPTSLVSSGVSGCGRPVLFFVPSVVHLMLAALH